MNILHRTVYICTVNESERLSGSCLLYTSRGLSDEEIDRLGYRTTPVVGMQTIARQLQSSGYYLSGVPGFYRKDGNWSFACESRGILIPVRDSKGRIQGMQIRRDNATRRKFRWVSSLSLIHI